MAAERWHAAEGGQAAAPRELWPPAPPLPPPPALRQARVPRGPLHDLQYPRPAAAALSALHYIEDPEPQLVRLIKQIGPARALAILPPALARAVRSLRAVARLLDGPSLDR